MFILIIKQKASISALLDRMVFSGNSLKFLECSWNVRHFQLRGSLSQRWLGRWGRASVLASYVAQSFWIPPAFCILNVCFTQLNAQQSPMTQILDSD